MFGLRWRTESANQTKNGPAHHSTTGVASASSTHGWTSADSGGKSEHRDRQQRQRQRHRDPEPSRHLPVLAHRGVVVRRSGTIGSRCMPQIGHGRARPARSPDASGTCTGSPRLVGPAADVGAGRRAQVVAPLLRVAVIRAASAAGTRRMPHFGHDEPVSRPPGASGTRSRGLRRLARPLPGVLAPGVSVPAVLVAVLITGDSPAATRSMPHFGHVEGRESRPPGASGRRTRLPQRRWSAAPERCSCSDPPRRRPVCPSPARESASVGAAEQFQRIRGRHHSAAAQSARCNQRTTTVRCGPPRRITASELAPAAVEFAV